MQQATCRLSLILLCRGPLKTHQIHENFEKHMAQTHVKNSNSFKKNFHSTKVKLYRLTKLSSLLHREKESCATLPATQNSSFFKNHNQIFICYRTRICSRRSNATNNCNEAVSYLTQLCRFARGVSDADAP